jgi:hypothetical protein
MLLQTFAFMKSLFFQNKLLIIGLVLGAFAGFLYWKLVGCNSGGCMITSKWHNSTAYGAVMGGLFLSIFKKEDKKQRDVGSHEKK